MRFIRLAGMANSARSGWLILIALALCVSGTAQTPPPSTGGGANTGTSPTTNSPARTGRGTDGTTGGLNSRRTPEQMPQFERPVFLSGRVMLASGEVPSEPIVIKRVCSTRTFPEGYTDSKGRFNFQIGANSGIAIADASSGSSNTQGILGQNTSGFGSRSSNYGDLNGVNLSGCSLVADAPGFRSSPVILTRYRSMDRNDVGVIILTPLGGGHGSIVSATSLAAPKKALASFEKGMKELQKGDAAKTSKAIEALEDAVRLYPEYAAAWTFLGQARLDGGDMGGARAAFEKALEADPRYARPYEPLARVAAGQEDWARVSEVTDLALRVAPSNMTMRWFRAVAQFELKDYEAAVASLTEIQDDSGASSQYPQTHHVLGLIFAEQGQFVEAAGEYRRYMNLVPDAPVADSLKQKLYEWEQLGVL